MITLDQLAPACARPQLWLDPLNEAMERFAINSETRILFFLAQCAHESARFVRLEENLNYSAAGLLRVWPSRFSESDAQEYAMNPRAIANRAYAKRGGNGDEASGDGWRYRGRGPLQVTLLNNYRNCQDDTGLPLVDQPELLAEPTGGALGSAWFWARAGCNEAADEGDFAGVSGIVNRGNRNKPALHMEDRFEWLRKLQSALT